MAEKRNADDPREVAGVGYSSHGKRSRSEQNAFSFVKRITLLVRTTPYQSIRTSKGCDRPGFRWFRSGPVKARSMISNDSLDRGDRCLGAVTSGLG
jgi:hypothetical protein